MKELSIHPYYGTRLREAKGIKRLLLKVLPLHTMLPLKFELHLAWVRLKTIGLPKKYKGISSKLINIGCGSRGLEGWINVDGFSAPSVNCICDCRKRLPFPDGSARGIFTEHFFEHVDYTEEALPFLSECHRVLEDGGVIRIIVPDGEKFLRAYCEDGWGTLSKLRGLENQYDRYTGCAYNTKMELVNEMFRQAYTHKYAYDFETIKNLLEKAGFRKIVRQEFGKSLMNELEIDLQDRAHESVYVDAVK